MKQIKTPTVNCLRITYLKHTKKQHSIYNKINKEAKIVANNSGVSEKVDCLAKSNAFISSKDHKPNFSLINPCEKRNWEN